MSTIVRDSKSRSYKDLILWQKSIEFVSLVYEFTKVFPEDERYGLISQIRRCAVSLPSNIAEGSKRGSKKEFINFLRIAYGSLAELETQLIISLNLNYITKKNYEKLNVYTIEISKMLNGLINKLK